MGLSIERDAKTGEITGIAVTPELPEGLTPEEALLTVILDPSSENLASGARHEDLRVRFAVALHPKLGPAVAAQLASDESDSVRRALASNPATPMEVLEALGEAEDLTVANAALRAMVERLRQLRQRTGR